MRAFSLVNKLATHLSRSYDVYNQIEISQSALLSNLKFFQQQTNTQIIPVLKGNAYGHGIEQVTQALRHEQLSYVAVDGYFEALRVQAVNPKQSVLVMGMIKPGNVPKLRLRRKAFVVHDQATIKAFGLLNKKAKLHLEINTGMNRYGINPAELNEYLKLIQSYPKLDLEGVMSHFADADGDDEQTVQAAVNIFDSCVEQVQTKFSPTYIHISQSAGSLRTKSRYANTSRVGIGFYGINPYLPNHPLYTACQALKPALTLKSTISEVHKLKKGDKVSYNYTFEARKTMHIGVLPLGYHEGLNRVLSNHGHVIINGKPQPIAGRVCMNHTMVALGKNDQLNDEVVVISNHKNDPNSIESLAQNHNLFTYNMLTNLSPDIRRHLTSETQNSVTIIN